MMDKIGFAPCQKLDSEKLFPGTRIRVANILPYIPNYIVSYDFDELKHCKAVIIQARWSDKDIELAGKLKEKGIKLLYDTTDPGWDTVNYDRSGKKRAAYDRLMPLIDIVILPTEKLKQSFLKYRTDKRIEIIPDNIDLDSVREVKKHIDKDTFVICWYGCRSNVCSVDLAREDLEKLGREFKITLIAVYDTNLGIEVNPFENIELIIRDWTNEITINSILESDVVINPRYADWKSYKSNNKTILTWAYGLPCIEENFYNKIKMYFKSTELRNKEYIKQIATVRQYDIRIIAQRLVNLCLG